MIREDELKHHGVPGMKWGVRKGYLTSNGKLTKSAKKDVDNAVTDAKLFKKAMENGLPKFRGHSGGINPDLDKSYEFIAKNKDSIKRGKKIIKKVYKQNVYEYTKKQKETYKKKYKPSKEERDVVNDLLKGDKDPEVQALLKEMKADWIG